MPLTTDSVPLVTQLDSLSLTNSSDNASSRLAATNVTSDRSMSSCANHSNSSQVNILQSSISADSPQRTNLSCSSGQTTTTAISSRDRAENSYRELTEDSVEEMRWQSVNRYLNFNPEGNSTNVKLWKKLAMYLYEKIVSWKRQEILSFKPSVLDFCVIHTDDEIDEGITREFMNHLELEGLLGKSLCNFGIGEDVIDTSAKILARSTTIFILNSISFKQSGLHRIQYKESLMKKLKYREWSHKLTPLHPSPRDVARYREKYPIWSDSSNDFSIFGMGSIKGIVLGDREKTVRLVRTVLTTDIQAENESRRRREQETFRFAIDCIKEKKCDQLRSGLIDLTRKFRELNLSTVSLAQLCMDCESLDSWSPVDGPEQIIRLENCREISIGPSFNFNIRPQSDDYLG